MVSGRHEHEHEHQWRILSLALALDERLHERLVLRDGLQDLAVGGHVPDGPLPEPRARQPEHVAARKSTRESRVGVRQAHEGSAGSRLERRGEEEERRGEEAAAAPAGLREELREARLDLVVREERAVARMRDGQPAPVGQNALPRVEQPARARAPCRTSSSSSSSCACAYRELQ